jgi:DNA helicase IV
VPHPELDAEQAYLDRAYGHLERMRALVERAPRTVDDEVVGAYLDAWAARRLATFEDAERGLCFGRLDVDASARPVYVGRRWVHDDDREAVVVNWQAPAARPFYTATPDEPLGVTLRRRFRMQGRRLLDVSDEALDGSGTSVAGGDFLLEELDRSRDRHMRDIVATIQTDQYALITRDAEPPLVVQGGPGTGKTAVGLHRASYLLYTHRDDFGTRRVLVVGPNPTFMEYVSHVLPTLGEENVEQRAVGDLVDGVATARVEARDVAAVKGDARLAEVIARAVASLPQGEARDLDARVGGTFVLIGDDVVAAAAAEAREEHGRGTAGRERFRMELLRRFYERYGRKLGDTAFASFDEIEQALRPELARVVDAAWPAVTADALVRKLLTSPSRLAEAAEGVLDRGEQRLLLRNRPRRAAELEWSEHDLALLDEAAVLLEAAPRRYAHVIVDEAQDLTPMQLRMIGRRVLDGSYTLLGDVAQATGPVPHASWEEVIAHLPHAGGAHVAELRHAYRVPAEIMALALPLLPRIAPTVAPPLAFRTGGVAPRIRQVPAAALLAEALAEARALAAEPGLLAVIAPQELLAALDPHDSAFDESIALLPPHRAKGLEFDHVVLVEPAAIAGDDLRGLRELYVALTRPTQTLTIVHAEPLPV